MQDCLKITVSSCHFVSWTSICSLCTVRITIPEGAQYTKLASRSDLHFSYFPYCAASKKDNRKCVECVHTVRAQNIRRTWVNTLIHGYRLSSTQTSFSWLWIRTYENFLALDGKFKKWNITLSLLYHPRWRETTILKRWKLFANIGRSSDLRISLWFQFLF